MKGGDEEATWGELVHSVGLVHCEGPTRLGTSSFAELRAELEAPAGDVAWCWARGRVGPVEVIAGVPSVVEFREPRLVGSFRDAVVVIAEIDPPLGLGMHAHRASHWPTWLSLEHAAMGGFLRVGRWLDPIYAKAFLDSLPADAWTAAERLGGAHGRLDIDDTRVLVLRPEGDDERLEVLVRGAVLLATHINAAAAKYRLRPPSNPSDWKAHSWSPPSRDLEIRNTWRDFADAHGFSLDDRVAAAHTQLVLSGAIDGYAFEIHKTAAPEPPQFVWSAPVAPMVTELRVELARSTKTKAHADTRQAEKQVLRWADCVEHDGEVLVVKMTDTLVTAGALAGALDDVLSLAQVLAPKGEKGSPYR